MNRASASSSTATECQSSDEPKQTLPNWRLVTMDSLEDGSVSKMVEERSEWSSEAYYAALEWSDQLVSCDDTYISSEIDESLKILNDAYRLYGPTCGVICSFNGGKDACVILELVRAAHARYYNNQLITRGLEGNKEPVRVVRPRVVYWDKKGEFPEVLDFVKETVERYDLDMIAFEQGIHFSQGLKLLVHSGKTPLAFVLGTRTSDPNAAGQGLWEPSSSFMPPFMRVNPVLYWNYGKVWQFLRSFQLPVCSLYQQGYTSLGTTDDTKPNPALFIPSLNRYRQAWMLTDYDQERSGRINLKKKAPKAADNTSVKSSQTNLSIMSRKKVNQQTIDQVPPEIGRKSLDTMESDISFGASVTQRTVGLLIIGDEILKGYTVDTNSQVAANALKQENVLLKRVVVVSDDMEEIVDEIIRMQDLVDVIVTSGGVGPTHDDVTIKSVAAAFGEELILHNEMAQLLRDKMGTSKDDELSEAQIKMATLPCHSKLRYLSDDKKAWPVLQCRNVFILPGVPEYFDAKIKQVATYLSCQLERSWGYKVVLSAEESLIVEYLNEVVERHSKHVVFGSYPFVNQPDRKTVITVEGKLRPCNSGPNGSPNVSSRNSAIFDRSMIGASRAVMDDYVQKALDDLIATLPDDCVLRVDEDNMFLFQ